MKKTTLKCFAAMLAAALIMTMISACGGGAPTGDNGVSEQGASAQSGTPPAASNGQGSETADQPVSPDAAAAVGAAVEDETPFGEYRSVDELLAILDGTAEDENAAPPEPEELPTESVGEDVEYAGGGVTTTFSDEPWEEPAVTFAELEMLDEDGNPIDESDFAVQDCGAGAGTGTEGAGGMGGMEMPGASDWASSSLTEGLPEPPNVSMAYEEDGAFTAMAQAESGEYAEYIQAVQSAGFSEGASEEDMSDFGFDMRSFSASHADGRELSITYMDGQLIVEIYG